MIRPGVKFCGLPCKSRHAFMSRSTAQCIGLSLSVSVSPQIYETKTYNVYCIIWHVLNTFGLYFTSGTDPISLLACLFLLLFLLGRRWNQEQSQLRETDLWKTQRTPIQFIRSWSILSLSSRQWLRSLLEGRGSNIMRIKRKRTIIDVAGMYSAGKGAYGLSRMWACSLQVIHIS